MAAYVAAGILVLMFLHIMLEIVLRTFFAASTFVLNEFVGYGVAAMSFLALGYALESGALIRVNVLLNPLSRWPLARRIAEVACGVLTLAAIAIPIVFFWRSIRVSYERGYTTGTMADIPQWLPEALMLAGLVLFWIQLLTYTIRAARNDIDFAAVDSVRRDTD